VTQFCIVKLRQCLIKSNEKNVLNHIISDNIYQITDTLVNIFIHFNFINKKLSLNYFEFMGE